MNKKKNEKAAIETVREEGIIGAKDKRVAAFQDTQRIIKSNKKLDKKTNAAIQNTAIYCEEFTAVNIKAYDPCNITVTEDCSFDAAEPLTKKYDCVAVLNFASAVNPGGGVTVGAEAQEEYLCRFSNLYNCLTKREIYEHFYKYHRVQGHSLYSDRVIYTKSVTVFKKGEREQYTDDWFDVDIITSPAPNLRHGTALKTDELSNILHRRIKNILEVASENNAEALVLGAFGCGAFRNPPDIVAGAFKSVLLDEGYNKRFKEIVFAIKRSDEFYCPNLTAFEEAFFGISEEGNKRRFWM